MAARGPVRGILPIIGIGLAVLLGLGAAQAAADVSISPVTASVMQNTADRVVIDFQLGDFEQGTVSIDGVQYTTIRMAREASSLMAGAPDLPHIARSVVIPDRGEMAVNVLSSEYREVADISIAPSKGNLLRSQDPAAVAYSFDAAIYESDAFYPGALAQLGEPYVLRDRRGVVVNIQPFQYNPVRRTLRVYTDVTIEVVPTGGVGVNNLDRHVPAATRSQAFEELYRAHFINSGPAVDYAPLNETGNMLVICHDAWIPNMLPFVEHKNAVGLPTTIVGVSTIPGGNSAAAIKSYIQNAYDLGGLAFVLLVGDAGQVATPTSSGGSSDATYAKLAGNDNYPDILVGRFSAETAEQVDTQVQRTTGYELPPATLQPWFWQGTGIASAQGAGVGDDGEADYVHIGNIRTQLLGAGYTAIDEIYDTNGGTAAMISTALNAGRGVVNYCGHGTLTSWTTTGFSINDIALLTNAGTLPFIFSVACTNGQFAGHTCFGEAWLRATRNGQPIGAVAAYMSAITQSWTPPMEAQDEFNSLLANRTYHSLGALCYAGSCSMLDKYGSGGVATFDTWIFFGDPSLRVVGSVMPPTGLGVTPYNGFSSSGPQGGPFSPPSSSFVLQNFDATPLTYQVTPTSNWLRATPSSGTLPGGASVTVTVSVGGAAIYLPAGLYQDTVIFTNLTSHAGDTMRSVTLDVGVPTPQYTWPLDSDPGWSVQGQWGFGQPLARGGSAHGNPDPSSGATGSYVYGVNLSGDYFLTIGGPYYLTMGPVDLSAITHATLKFQRWLNTDNEPYVQATVDVSHDGAAWTTVWSNGANEITDAAWSLQSLDISAAADFQPTVYIRWGHRIAQAYAYAYSGWNIDDVAIWGIVPAGPRVCRGDCDCDGTIGFADIDYFVTAIPSNTTAWSDFYASRHSGNPPPCAFANCDCNGDGQVDFGDIDAFVALIPSTCP